MSGPRPSLVHGEHADDGEEDGSGDVVLDSSDLELTFDGSNQIVGIRFDGVVVPPRATILEAWIQFQVDEESSDPTSLTLEGEAVDPLEMVQQP